MMRVLVTGANGQLGYCLQSTVPKHIELIAADRNMLDLSRPQNLREKLLAIKPELIINAAAYTAVDKAESEPELAETVNATSVGVMAVYCNEHDIPFVQVSTDFVFNGEQSTPYKPDDKAAPLSVYGRTKLKGEQIALSNCSKTYIVRTGWVYAEHGANFVKTMLRLGQDRDELSVVADQVGTPTYARNLAKMIWRLVEVLPEQRIFHFSDAGVASWYDFAVAVFDEAVERGMLPSKPQLKPIPSTEYPTPAIRPAYSVLDKSSVWGVLNVEYMYWRAALRAMLAAMKALRD